MTTPSPGSSLGATDPAVNTAVADLAARLQIDGAQVAVSRHEEVSWPDSSLGCPRPGFNYTQVITAGYLIVLTVDGRSYEYHGKAGQPPFYCESPRPPSTGPWKSSWPQSADRGQLPTVTFGSSALSR